MKIMVQTSSVKLCDFYSDVLHFVLGKNLVYASSTECQKPRSNKN